VLRDVKHLSDVFPIDRCSIKAEVVATSIAIVEVVRMLHTSQPRIGVPHARAGSHRLTFFVTTIRPP